MSRYTKPLLISGCPRTGTTALARTISEYAAGCVFNEMGAYVPNTRFEREIVRRVGISADKTDPRKTSLYPLLLHDARDLAERSELKGFDLVHECYDRVARSKGQPLKIYGDKYPIHYLKQLPTLLEQIPQAKFIITMRDGRDVIASQIRHYRGATTTGKPPLAHWMKPTVAEAEYLWLDNMRTWEHVRSTVSSDRVLIIRYEEITSDLFGWLETICNFCGMAYNRDEWNVRVADDPKRPPMGATSSPTWVYGPRHLSTWSEVFSADELSSEFKEMLQKWDYL